MAKVINLHKKIDSYLFKTACIIRTNRMPRQHSVDKQAYFLQFFELKLTNKSWNASSL